MDNINHNNQATLLDLYSGEQWNLNIERIIVAYTYKDGIRVVPDTDASPWLPYRCEIRLMNGEHWLYPATNMSPYHVPCLINDSDIIGPCRLTHGSTVQLGRSLFRFTHPASAQRKWRSSHQCSEFTCNSHHSDIQSNIEENSNILYTSDCDCDFDNFLLDQLASPDKIANLASSYVCHQLLLYTDGCMSAQLVDQLFKAFQEQPDYSEILSKFILRYNKATQSSGPEATIPAHQPVIRLLIELLKFSLDPVGHNILWLKLLEAFCHVNQNLHTMLDHEATATIMGTMAAHRACPEIQAHACEVLRWLATFKQLPCDKIAMKESIIELVVEAMKTHGWDERVLRPACGLLANLTACLTDRAHSILTKMCTNGTTTETPQLIMQVLSLLDTLRDRALPYVKARARRFPRDFQMQTDARRMDAYFFAPNVLLSPEVPTSPVISFRHHRHVSNNRLKRSRSNDDNDLHKSGKKAHLSGDGKPGSFSSSSSAESCDSSDDDDDDDDWI